MQGDKHNMQFTVLKLFEQQIDNLWSSQFAGSIYAHICRYDFNLVTVLRVSLCSIVIKNLQNLCRTTTQLLGICPKIFLLTKRKS